MLNSMLIVVLGSLLVALADVASAANPSEAEPVKYVLTFPKIWRRNNDFKFHLVLFQNPNYTLPVTFVANLSYSGKQVATQTFIQRTYDYQAHTFQNSAGVESAEVFDGSDYSDDSSDDYSNVRSGSLQVTVEFKSRGLSNTSTISSHQTKLTEKFVFIQTDKAVYKPTQNVKIRVMAIDRDLKPLASAVEVAVRDANDNILQQWTGRNLTNGFYAANFTLTDVAAEGEWTISVKGDNIPTSSKTFAVEQYVLPKFEVKFDFPANYWMISSNETTYKGYVRAKYTFGKTVKGKAFVVLTGTGSCNYRYDSREYYERYGSSFGYYDNTPLPPILNFTINLAGDGNAEDGAFTLSGRNRSLNRLLFFGKEMPIPITLPPGYEQCQLSFFVNVTEELTGENITGDGSVTVYGIPYKIQVHDSVQKTLKPGLPFKMSFEITQPDGSPLTSPVDATINVFHDVNSPKTSYSTDHCWQIQTGTHNASQFSVETFNVRSDADGLVTIVATPPPNAASSAFAINIAGSKAKLCESRSPPKTVSNQSLSIQIERSPSAGKTLPKVNQRMRFNVLVSYRASYVYFLLTQNGQVLEHRKLSPQSSSGTSTLFVADVVLPAQAAPKVAASAWTVEPNAHEVLADAIEFKVDGLVKQSLTAGFVPNSVRPREMAKLNVRTSEPGATVALLAVDKSVQLLRSGNDVTLDDVLASVGAGSGSDGVVSPVLWRCFFCGWWPWWVDSSSAESVYNSIGMEIQSNAITRQEQIWYPYMGGGVIYDAEVEFRGGERERGPVALPAPPMAGGDVVMSSLPSTPDHDGADKPVVRNNFPESWIWEFVQTNSSGGFSKDFEAPDTITTWMLSAIAIGNRNGLGILSSPAELNVFKEFFVNLDIQHPTIIRGEQVEVKAVVFNYQNTPLNVSNLLRQSNDFDVSLDNGRTFARNNFTRSIVVPPNSGQSIPIWVKPKSLGNINLELSGIAVNDPRSKDAMRKEILVEAEGEVKYANNPTLIRLSPPQTSTRMTIDVDSMLGSAAQSVVNGSKFFQLQAVGDILGPALANLGKQIRLPTGCGEQTMVQLAPNVYIYKYLEAANILLPEVKSRAIRFVDQGYQHELQYQRKDGGFSAFGDSDEASSTWLSAFVMRCFHAAAKHMGTSISQEVYSKTWSFLKQVSKTDGTFLEPGVLHHHSMKGGANSNTNLATYIYTTFAEAGAPSEYQWPSLARTRSLIIQAGSNTSNRDPYALAISAYALSILDTDKTSSRTILSRLLSLAIRRDGLMFWELPKSNNPDSIWESSGPSQIETAAYALLALMNHNQTESAIIVARYLMSKRNSLGGFYSTQDTVVGLQALATVAPLLSAANTGLNVSASFVFADGRPNITTSFQITSQNTRVLQSFDPDRTRQNLKLVDVTVTGSGVGLVQLSAKYNVQNQRILDSGDYTLLITREVMARKKRETSAALADPEVQLKACTKPVTLKARRGMVVMELGIPTGFEANLEATEAANANTNGQGLRGALKMIEEGDRKLVYYFNTLENNLRGEGACVIGRLSRTSAATNVQPPMARVYGYYTPELTNATAFSFRGMSYGVSTLG